MKPSTTQRVALFFGLCLLLSIACRRKLSREETKEQLEKAMSHKLQTRKASNTPQLRFDVLDVNYYEEAKYYRCEFTVKMTLPDGKDTTGIMLGKVSKDFSEVR